MTVFWVICCQCKCSMFPDEELTAPTESDEPCDQCIWDEENYEAEKEGL